MVHIVHKLALVRHGQSLYNLENKFAGWADVDLTETGRKEAIQVRISNKLISPSKFPEGNTFFSRWQAGELLRTEGFEFDFAYTSVLKRCIKTLQLILEELDQLWIPVQKDWRLNERHYGDLQDKNKAQTAQKYGEKQLQDWRRGFDTLPAPVEGGKQDPRFPGNDPRYSHVDPAELPLTESLQLTVQRVLPYWSDTIAPALKSGKNVIIVAHGNSIRALVKYLEDVPDEKIRSIEIATGVPVIYELDEQLKPIRHYYVGNAEAFKKRVGFLGIDIQAERLLKAFTSRGLELRDDIMYYSPDSNADIEKLPVKPASQDEVVKGSDVLFLSGSLKHIEATIKSIQSSFKDQQIVVAVCKDAKLDELQVWAGEATKLVLAISENELQWQPKDGQDGPEGARVLLKKGNHASELDRNIITTLFEAAGYDVVKKDNLLTKT